MLVQFERLPFAQPRFDTVFNFGLFPEESEVQTGAYPRIDATEYPDETVVVAEVPGLAKEDLKLSIEKGVLAITGEFRRESLPEKSEALWKEIVRGPFSRSVVLPHDVDTGRVSAELSNGLLRIVLPKAEKARAREIPIQ